MEETRNHSTQEPVARGPVDGQSPKDANCQPSIYRVLIDPVRSTANRTAICPICGTLIYLGAEISHPAGDWDRGWCHTECLDKRVYRTIRTIVTDSSWAEVKVSGPMIARRELTIRFNRGENAMWAARVTGGSLVEVKQWFRRATDALWAADLDRRQGSWNLWKLRRPLQFMLTDAVEEGDVARVRELFFRLMELSRLQGVTGLRLNWFRAKPLDDRLGKIDEDIKRSFGPAGEDTSRLRLLGISIRNHLIFAVSSGDQRLVRLIFQEVEHSTHWWRTMLHEPTFHDWWQKQVNHDLTNTTRKAS